MNQLFAKILMLTSAAVGMGVMGLTYAARPAQPRQLTQPTCLRWEVAAELDTAPSLADVRAGVVESGMPVQEGWVPFGVSNGQVLVRRCVAWRSRTVEEVSEEVALSALRVSAEQS